MRDNNKNVFSNALHSEEILNTNKNPNIKNNSKNLIVNTNTNYNDINLCSSSLSKSVELDNIDLREKVFSNPKFIYNISIFLPIESIIKLMMVNREYYYRISNNKVFIDALEIKHNKTTGEIIYIKEFDWLNKRKPQLSEISAEVECTINSQKQILNLLNKIWIYLFFIVIVNVFFYLIAMLKENILTITQEEDYWKLILPLSIFWAFTLIILIIILIVKLYYNFKLREILTAKLREYKIFSSLRMEFLFKEYKMKYRNKITSIFTKYLIAYILFWIPFLINYNIMPQSRFESNELFSLGGMIFLGVFYLKELFSFLKAKIYYFTDSKISKYKEIVKNSKKDFLIEKLDNEVMQFQK